MLKKHLFKKTILVTGHTGFKGSWLSLWLKKMGAKVIGYSLPPKTTPNHFDLLSLKDHLIHIEGDLRDLSLLKKTLNDHKPDLIFHLAAQPLVLQSIEDPKETFETNIMGTVNLFEAIKTSSSVKATVVVTSDKCYKNQGWLWGYRETDPLGGKDPYSASKAMTEILISSYREIYFKKRMLIASARAGNVIGGADFSSNRLIPDIAKALQAKKPVIIRNPNSVRPWLYVLEALYGYLILAQNLLENNTLFAQEWNFGPLEPRGVLCKDIVEKAFSVAKKLGYEGEKVVIADQSSLESPLLRLNWDKAAHLLNWSPVYRWEKAVEETIKWYCQWIDSFHHPKNFYHIALEKIAQYEEDKNAVYQDSLKRCLSHRT